jgi:hypothetical protein
MSACISAATSGRIYIKFGTGDLPKNLSKKNVNFFVQIEQKLRELCVKI